MNELTALTALVLSAGGRAAPEPVSILALATESPWAGDRRGVRDRPDKITSNRSASAVTSTMRTLSPHLADPLPPGRGWLAWMRYRGLAMPLADLTTAPAWISDPALEGAWVTRPPRGAFHGPELDAAAVLGNDGRLAALHLLAQQIGPEVSTDALQVLADWCVGPRAADWSPSIADQAPMLRFQQQASRGWRNTYRGLSPLQVFDLVTGPPVIDGEHWTPPPPTADEILAQQQAELRRKSLAMVREEVQKNRLRDEREAAARRQPA